MAIWSGHKPVPSLCALISVFGASIALCSSVAYAVSITIEDNVASGPRPKSSVSVPVLRLTGLFESGDAAKLRTVLSRLKATARPAPGMPFATATLSSTGGDVYEGLNVGYLFSEFDVATVVRKGDLCLSACALAFLGGTLSHVPPSPVPDRSIEIGGQVGFHNFFLNPNSPDLRNTPGGKAGLIAGFDLARGGASLLVRYSAMMSIDPSFIARLLGRPSDEWEYVDLDGEFVSLMSCAIGLGRPELSNEAVATNICNHATGWMSPADPSQARQMTGHEAKRHLLELVRRSVEGMEVRGSLAAPIAGAIAARDERATDAVYSDLRRAGIVLPEVMGPTFEVSGYAIGPYQMRCTVSFSKDDPDKYDAVIEGPAGFSHALRTAPQQCRRLFLYDQDAVINPTKN